MTYLWYVPVRKNQDVERIQNDIKITTQNITGTDTMVSKTTKTTKCIIIQTSRPPTVTASSPPDNTDIEDDGWNDGNNRVKRQVMLANDLTEQKRDSERHNDGEDKSKHNDNSNNNNEQNIKDNDGNEDEVDNVEATNNNDEDNNENDSDEGDNDDNEDNDDCNFNYIDDNDNNQENSDNEDNDELLYCWNCNSRGIAGTKCYSCREDSNGCYVDKH